MKLHLYRNICGVVLLAGCLAVSLTACKGREQGAETGAAQAEETAAEEEQLEVAEDAADAKEAAEGAAGAEEATEDIQVETEAPDSAASASSAAEPKPEEGVEMPNMEQMPDGGLPDAAMNPAGMVRVLVTLKHGVSIQDGLNAISKEVLNGAEPEVHRTDEATGEVNLAVTPEQMEALQSCSVVETVKAQLQIPMH